MSTPGGGENISEVWRAKLLDALRRRIGLTGLAPRMVDKAFLVHCKPVGTGRAALRYLSRYIFRVAISNHNILALENDQVTFRYRERKNKRIKTKTTQLPALEFIRRFMQHILPKGFVKVRHYGFLHPNTRIGVDQLRELIYGFYDAIRDLLPAEAPVSAKPLLCRRCGGKLMLRFIERFSHEATASPSVCSSA